MNDTIKYEHISRVETTVHAHAEHKHSLRQTGHSTNTVVDLITRIFPSHVANGAQTAINRLRTFRGKHTEPNDMKSTEQIAPWRTYLVRLFAEQQILVHGSATAYFRCLRVGVVPGSGRQK